MFLCGFKNYNSGIGLRILRKGYEMSQIVTFADALEAAESLDPDSQAELVAILNRRLAERGRERIIESVAQARREHEAGQSQPMTAAEIVREALP
jgi:hypothetical protein